MIADSKDYDALVRTITEEVLAYLGEPAGNSAPELIDAGADRISAEPHVHSADADVAALIDHTSLKPDASRDEIRELCEEAVKFGFASVCVNPWNVAQAAELVRESRVKVCSVVGFPLGATLTQAKIYEAEQVIKLGALEVDMVQNVGALKSGMDDMVEEDIRGVVRVAHSAGAICKVILETALLTNEEKVRASLAAKRAGADFVKTSTGFAASGATAEDVALMRRAVGAQMGIKASGGIRTFEDLRKMIGAGATRIGASASVKIIAEASEERR